MHALLEQLWYKNHPLRWLLWPFSLGYQGITSIRRVFLKAFKQQHFSVPVIVVGNLTVGGVGKTPLVIALAKALQKKGLRVGIVSRGYGGKTKKFPYAVSPNDDAKQVGDEPLLMAKKTGCPVVIAPKRKEAVCLLLEKYKSQIIISDDGLQHYALGRSIEIVVIDGVRGLGNGMCLPAGPLRERSWRLKQADFLVANSGSWPGSYPMVLQPGQVTRISNGQIIPTTQLSSPVAAVAAIGHPVRFFMTLKNLGIAYNPHPFPDHHQFSPKDLTMEEKCIVMTEKDAVKCKEFAADHWYFLPVEAKLSDTFWQAFWAHKNLQGCC